MSYKAATVLDTPSQPCLDAGQSARTRLDETASIDDARRAVTIYRRPFEEIDGMDYESPDFDMASLGLDTDRTRKRRIVKQFLAENTHLSTKEIIERGEDKDISEAEIRHIIGYLDGKGDIALDADDNWYSLNL